MSASSAPRPVATPAPAPGGSESGFRPYLSDPSFLDDDADADDQPSRKSRRRRGKVADDEINRDHADSAENENITDAAAGDNDSCGPNARPIASWTKALILTAAMVVIGAFAWFAAERFVGASQWIIKFSCVAWLIGMATATAMLGANRTGVAAKLLGALAAVLAIALGKALLLCHPDLAPELSHFTTVPDLARTFAQLAIKPIDGLFAALAVMGLAARFILSARE